MSALSVEILDGVLPVRLTRIFPSILAKILFLKSHIFVFAILCFCLTASYSFALPLEQTFNDASDIPWEIVADEIYYNKKDDVYIAKGNVVISKMDRKLVADFVRYDHKAMKAYAKGNVKMTAGEDILTGSSMDVDLDTQTGTLTNGSIFVKENHFYIKGDNIRKTGKDSYFIDKASITTCDGDNPAWKITGKNLKVTLEGYGYISHAAFWAKKAPMLYTPFMFFPVKLKRQTGFLPPQIGYEDRKGAEYTQPFFWAISESTDATFHEHYMSRRGHKFGFEYRYVLGDESKGALMCDFLDDKEVDDGKSDSSDDWGYNDEGEDVLRPNSDRYWFRMKHDHALPFGFSAKLDLDIVSDQDYLHEFKGGYTGFGETEKYFLNNFDRELDDYTDPVRVNRLNISKSWSKYSFNAETRWYDDVVARRQDKTDRSLQKLPYIGFDASKQQLFTSPFYWNLDSEYTYFYSEDGSRGHRADIHPRLYLPYKFYNYFSFEPSIGVRETFWHTDRFEEAQKDNDSTDFRELYDIKLDLSSEIYKMFHINGKRIDRIKHTIRPKIVYDYIPDKSQDGYPSLNSLSDSINRIPEKNLITYSVTNTFTSRAKKAAGNKSDNNKEPLEYDYRQFCRVKLEQSFNISEERENDSSKWADGEHKRPFSPIYGKLEFDPFRYLSIDADAKWSPYEGDFESRNIELRISNNRGDSLFLEHRYTRDSTESIYADAFVNITERFSAYATFERNLEDDDDIESGIGFMYAKQCWAVNFGFSNDDGDVKYSFMVDLYGLGGLGKQSLIRDRAGNTFGRFEED